MTFDRIEDEERGYNDALAGRPRETTRPYYRRGYDHGLALLLAKNGEDAYPTSANQPLGS